MVLRLLIDAVHADETRVVIADNTRIHDFDFVTAAKKQVKGNIYLAKITRVEPSLQAAFVEYGGGKQGFLPFAEIHPDYYQIPMADRQRLLEEAESAAEAAEAEEDEAVLPTPEQTATDAAELKAEEKATHSAELFEAPVDVVITAPTEEGHLAAALPEVTAVVPAAESAVIPPFPYDTKSDAHTAFAAVEPVHALTEIIPTAEQAVVEVVAEQSEHHAETHEIETIASEEEAVSQSRPANFHRRYKIQEVIKRNQIVLVQVIKEERGNKGVSLTTFISLAGRYCVLMPNSPKGGGISRKIMSGDDRRRLKEISAELKTARGMSAIIRTAGIDRTRAEIKRDYEYLVKLWETIREQTLSSTAPALIYEEGDLVKRTIRDLYSADIEEIVVEGEDGYNQAKEFLKMILASHAPKVKLYQENVPLFYAYGIEDQLASMYDPVVKLRSGGYIVLDPTEALISIDVNSGRSTGERNIEETATKTNLEAAAEIARQLRLRDLAGLVVIDFIDMMDSRNRRSVERALKDALKLDRAKIQIGRISPFGLLEMSRQRLRPSLSETSTMPCPHCQGRGIIRSDASVAIQIIRAAEKEAASGQFSEIKLMVPPSVALHLLNTRRDALSTIEKKYEISLHVLTDVTLPQGNFRLDKVKAAQAKRFVQTTEPVSVTMDDLPPIDENITGEEAEILVPSQSVSPREPREDRGDRGDRPYRRGRRGGRNRGQGNRNFHERSNTDAAGPSPEGTQEATPQEGAENTPRENRPPRERGERGGRNRRPRRWRDKNGNYQNTNNNEGDAQRQHAPAEGNVMSYQPEQRPHTPQPRASTPSPVPSLDQQASSSEKPKKGWWRRMVE